MRSATRIVGLAAVVLMAATQAWGISAVEIDGNVEVDESTWTFAPGKLIHDIRSHGAVACDASVDSRTELAAIVGNGGSGAGKTVRIPTNCRILIGSPGAGNAAITLASNTTIECQDRTAGFVLAGRYCDADSTFPGAACTADADCLPNSGGTQGSCIYDGDASASFAPSAGSTYTLFAGETDAEDLSVVGCSIWTQNDNGRAAALGGSGIRHGYCDGAGTSDLGQACGSFCDSNAGILEGLACTTADAATTCGNASWCTEGDTTCTDAGGACISIAYGTDWSVAGAGDIQVMDWLGNVGSTVEDVTVWDHLDGDFTVRLGGGGEVLRSKLSETSLIEPQHDTWSNFARAGTVKIGIDATGDYNVVRDVWVQGWDTAVRIGGYGQIRDSVLEGFGSIDDSGTGADEWKGTVGIRIEGGEAMFAGNRIRTFIGFLPVAGSGFNFLATANRMQGGQGPKYIVHGSGNQYQQNYEAWGSVGSVVSFGDPRGYCSGGPRANELCLVHAGQNAGHGCPFACSESATKACVPRCAGGGSEGVMCDVDADCPSSTCDVDYDCSGTCQTGTTYTCEPDADFPVASSNHAIVSNNLIHTDVPARNTETGDRRAGVKFMAFAADPRCDDNSVEAGESCQGDGDCTGGFCLNAFTHSHATAEGNIFYSGAYATAVEFPDSNGLSLINGFKFDNHYQGFEVGFSFPASPSYTISNLELSGLMSGVTTPLENWDWSYGNTSGLTGLVPGDDQVQVVTLAAGEALTRGMVVTASSSVDLNVIKAANSNAVRAVGVVLEDVSLSETVKLATSGRMRCLAGGTVSRQDLLKVDASDAGKFVSGSTGDVILGVALEAGTNGNEFDCIFNGPGANDSSTYPKFSRAENTGSVYTGASATCTSADELTKLPAYSTGSSTSVVLQARATFKRTGGSGEGDMKLVLYDGGSTTNDCDAGGTLVAPDATFEIPSGEADSEGFTMTAMWFDTGDNSSHTYRLCYCLENQSWSGLTVSDAALFLTEYQG